MSTTTCPYCGKPIRPGARFCGSCGKTISSVPIAQAALSPASVPALNCPKCGKPVRMGAKFCTNCGQTLPQELDKQADNTSGESVGTTSITSQPAATAIEAAPGATHPSGGVPARPVAPVQNARRRSARIIWPVLAVILLLICGLGAAAGYLYTRDPLDWRATATPASAAVIPSETSNAAPTEAPTELVPPATETEALSVTVPVEPPPTATATASLTIEATLATTPTLQMTSAPTLVVTLPAASIWLQDDFSGALNINWKAWGEPRPIIRSGFGDSWLDLAATDTRGSAGVTTRAEFPNAPGIEIQFEAQLNNGYIQYPLFLDWDPIQYNRGPDNTEPTVVHLAIQKNRFELQTPASDIPCQQDFDGAVKHIYVLKFVAEKSVELYLDDGEQALCQMDMGIKPVPGRITFTGTGWITRILVAGTPLP